MKQEYLIQLKEGQKTSFLYLSSKSESQTQCLVENEAVISLCTGAALGSGQSAIIYFLKLFLLHQFRDCNPRKCSRQGEEWRRLTVDCCVLGSIIFTNFVFYVRIDTGRDQETGEDRHYF